MRATNGAMGLRLPMSSAFIAENLNGVTQIPSTANRARKKCEKCGGAGWLWGRELEDPSDETFADTMTHYMCDDLEHDWNQEPRGGDANGVVPRPEPSNATEPPDVSGGPEETMTEDEYIDSLLAEITRLRARLEDIEENAREAGELR